MPEVPLNDGLYLEDVRQNFADFLREVWGKIPDGNNLGRMHFGPTYLATTERSLSVSLLTLIVDPTPGQTRQINQGSLPLEQSFIIFALSEDGELAGYRYLDLTRNDNWLEARGDIATARRGKGVSTYLELATMDLLRVQAAKQEKEIYWQVENGNLNRVLQAEEKYGKSPDPGEVSLLNQIRQEQSNWQQLYGPSGKFGFNRNRTLVVQPDRDYRHIDFELIDTANLRAFPIEEGGRWVLIPWAQQMLWGDRIELRSKKLSYYNNVLKPKIEALIIG